MPKFKYKFESIKRIKKIIEKKVQKELLEIIVAIRQKEEEIQELDNIKQNAKNELSSKQILTVQELRFQNNYDKFIEEKKDKIKKEIAALEKSRILKMKELTEKSKEHKIFELLKEKHLEDFIIEESRKEQKAIDEVANLRYSRS